MNKTIWALFASTALVMPAGAYAQQVLAQAQPSEQTPPSAQAPSSAQSQPPAQANAGADRAGAEIIVTAQKRSEKLSDVPLSITAASAAQLSNAGVTAPADLVKIVPGFTYQPSAYGTPVFTMRGIGFYDVAVAVAPAVSVYVDQVPLPYLAMTEGASLDVERVEALKGPQGTLFGQNSTGGAINYIAAKPTRDPAAGFDLTYGRFNQIDTQAFVSGPISDTLTARLSVRHEARDGWQVSQTRPNDRLGDRDFSTGRLILDWKPTDRLRFELNANGWIDKSETQAAQFVKYAPTVPPSAGGYTDLTAALQAAVPAPNKDRIADWDPNTSLRRNDNFYQFSLRGDYDLTDAITLTSLSAYSHFKQRSPTDSDGVNVNNFLLTIRANIESISQELRLAGKSGPFRWMIGGNYGHDKTADDQEGFYTASNSGVGPFRYNDFINSNHQKITTKAVFGSLDYELTSTLTAQASARYSNQRNRFRGCLLDAGDGEISTAFSFLSNSARGFAPPTVALAPGACATLGEVGYGTPLLPVPIVEKSLHEDNVSWRGSLNWKPNTDTLLYANVTKGYKAGSFPTVPGLFPSQFDPVKQESVLAYEAGFKLSLFDRKMQLTGAGFYYKYNDKQIIGYITTAFGNLPGLVQVPRSSVRGGELSLNWRPIRGLTLNGGVTYVNSRVDRSYLANDPYAAVIDIKGESFPSTPKWQFNGDIDYRFAVTSNLDLSLGGNVRYRTKSAAAFGDAPEFVIPAYAIVDLRAGVESPSGKWKVQVWGRNITNKFYITNVTHVVDTVARTTGMPATYGMTLSFRF